MASKGTPSSTRNRPASVEIGKASRGGQYTDEHNIIKFTRYNDKPENGYTKYVHTVPDNCYVKTIKHDNKDQNGFDLKSQEYTEVTVYFIEYDNSSLLPLVVGITKGNGTYEYFIKEEYFNTSDRWKKDGEIKNDGTLKNRLAEINKKTSGLMVLKVDANADSKYYANGDIQAPKVNDKIEISVSQSFNSTNTYKIFTHKPKDGKMRVLTTRNASGNFYPFNPDNAYITECDSIFLYHWYKDEGNNRVLILELKSSGNAKYFKLEGGKWVPENTTETLDTALRRENCIRNGLHAVDLDKNTSGPYPCPICKTTINLTSQTPENAYTKCTHSINNSNFRSVISKRTDQDGINISSGINKVVVFHFPPSKPSPILICIPSLDKRWYKKSTKDGNKWEKIMENTPTNEHDTSKIRELLKKIQGELKKSPTPSESSTSQSGGTTTNKDTEKTTRGVETTTHTASGSGGNITSEQKPSQTTSPPPSSVAAQKAESSPVGIVVGVIVGVVLVSLVIYEGFMLRRNPEKSITTRVMSKLRGRKYPPITHDNMHVPS
ncbi:hypothetical protein BEWA_048270 [Theileria equi strain WA]|uniref:Uncharacterized protein n=1 Tax=Theileria equi strain WA TaxID=1537102 RepID=L1LAQ6_THEEQ|nr:hypothetical protein BEWA_048270 [Theileria equi strain WA]EKX72360.1 hypothetical protein BEWA_048270 [Theileria equi strain WA]|eukprot:XP_004831812.1 hypothetical protein BEWA_048270 [Theileria equi strain WA]